MMSNADVFLSEKIKKLKSYSVEYHPNIELKLDANESFIQPPAYIREKIAAAISELDLCRYPDPLSLAAVERYSEYSGVRADCLTAGNGSDELISVIINSFLSKGDKIITFSPDFTMYAFYAGIIEADIITVKKTKVNNFAVDFSELGAMVRNLGVRLVIFSNPCNPTGQAADIAALENFLASTPALVVVDEVYNPFMADAGENSLLHKTDLYPNLIILKSLSKTLGLAGIRMGFAAANQTLTERLRAAKSPYNVNVLTQKTAEIILSEREYADSHLARLIENKSALEKAFADADADNSVFTLYPTHTNFLFAESEYADEYYRFLIANRVLIRNLGGGFIRISAGSAEENQILLNLTKKFIERVKKE